MIKTGGYQKSRDIRGHGAVPQKTGVPDFYGDQSGVRVNWGSELSSNAAAVVVPGTEHSCDDFALCRKVSNTMVLGVFDGITTGGMGSIAGRAASVAFLESVQKSRGIASPETAEKALAEANNAVLKSGGGSAAVTALVDVKTGIGVISWLGDCRAYKINSHGLEPSKEDNQPEQLGLIESIVEAFFGPSPEKSSYQTASVQCLTRDQAIHPTGKLETYLGSADRRQSRVMQTSVSLLPGDQLLLCSDGLHRFMKDSSVLKAIGSNQHPRGKAQRIAELINGVKQRDDAGFVIVKF